MMRHGGKCNGRVRVSVSVPTSDESTSRRCGAGVEATSVVICLGGEGGRTTA